MTGARLLAPLDIQRITTLPHTAVTHERTYRFVGEPLHFQTNDVRLLAAAEAAFGRHPPPAPSKSVTGQVRLFVHSPHPSRPAGLPEPAVYLRHENLILYSFGGDNLGVIDGESGVATGYVIPETANDLDFVRLNFCETLGLGAISLPGRFLHVHAGCLVKDGLSLMLHASSGTGKSTLAYAGVRRGYRLLTEDMVHVKVRPEGIELWGVPWTVHPLPDAIKLFPELAHHARELRFNREVKLEVNLEKVFPGSTIERAEPGIAVILGRGTGGPTRLDSLPPQEAARQAQVIVNWNRQWEPAFDLALQKLFAQGSYRLHMNGAPDQALDMLDELVAKWQKGDHDSAA
jgi:hypothetical protein